jgi:hypothetical protein
MQQEVHVPTREELESQLTGLVMQRSQLKDQIEMVEKQMPTLNGMIQLLAAQEAKAEAEAIKED